LQGLGIVVVVGLNAGIAALLAGFPRELSRSNGAAYCVNRFHFVQVAQLPILSALRRGSNMHSTRPTLAFFESLSVPFLELPRRIGDFGVVSA
jgi:hypothetical protein